MWILKKDLLLHNRGCDRRSQAIRDFSPMAFQIIYEHHLDNGYTPFYLVDVYQQETLFLRALYTYDGACLSIVKPGEDFAQYSSPDPVFSDAYPLSQEQWLRLPYLSVEEKYQEAEKMRPFVEAWIERYPYYLNNPGNEFDMTLRNHYAVPDAQSISQEEAIATARTLGEEFGISTQSMDDREVIVHYLLDDDHQPFWRITICRAAADKKALREDDSLNKMYAVKIDAYTGNVLDLYQVSHDTPDYQWRY